MAGGGITSASAVAEDDEDAAVPYVLLPGDGGEVVAASEDDDGSRLSQLGYKQELSRSLSDVPPLPAHRHHFVSSGPIVCLPITFSIVSILTGLTTTFNTGLTFGGPVTMIYGWPIAGMFTLLVGLSMAEICSSYPTSGGLYYWSSKLCGKEWGPFASWITGCLAFG